jgi:integrase
MLSSGMGAAEVKNLTYGDFLKGILEYIELNKSNYFDIELIYDKLKNQNNLIGTWKIHRVKTGKPYYTFNSPESTDAILEYLSERQRHNIAPKSEEDPLFISDQKKKLSDMPFYIYSID